MLCCGAVHILFCEHYERIPSACKPTGGGAEFWLKTDTYLEQPDVTYTKQLLFLAEGFKGGEAFSASFATLAGVNGLNHAGLRAAVVKVTYCDKTYTRLVSDDHRESNSRIPFHTSDR